MPLPVQTSWQQKCRLAVQLMRWFWISTAKQLPEKCAMGFHMDGRASLVVGTHTHIPTSDTRILPHGTAYQTDAGMCGDYNSVIGMQKQAATGRFNGKPAGKLAVATGTPSLCGVLVDIDPDTGLAVAVRQIRKDGILAPSA